MVEDSYHASYEPNPNQVKRLFEYSEMIAQSCDTETQWYSLIQQKAMNWLEN